MLVNSWVLNAFFYLSLVTIVLPWIESLRLRAKKKSEYQPVNKRLALRA